MIGTIVDGRYRILRRLGIGGMGEVYLGEHIELGRREAIKVLKSRFAKDEGHMARFRREARATNRVQHPNIVAFYDFGKLADGRLYLTMEFADGPDLETVLKKEGRLEPFRVVHILRQIALAIDYAHGKGVIHRDLKPQNLILLQQEGKPDLIKVLDFGVAKITAPGYLESKTITKEGEVFGTPAYISPEQIRGVSDDPRIDVYAMGCIAYELLTGETPFQGRPMAVLDAHLSREAEPPSTRCLDARIPSELDSLIMACLAKDPVDRIESGAAVAEHLSSIRIATPRVHAGRRQRADSAGGFEGVSTVEGMNADITLYEDAMGTTGVYRERYEMQARRNVRMQAECLVDLGCSEPLLLVFLAEANQVQTESDDLVEELSGLRRSDAMVAQKGREREASLRFALAELKFGADSGASSESLKQAVAVISNRLANSAEQVRQQHLALMEGQIDKTAVLASKQEELRDADARLAVLVENNLSAFKGNPQLGALSVELERCKRLIREGNES